MGLLGEEFTWDGMRWDGERGRRGKIMRRIVGFEVDMIWE